MLLACNTMPDRWEINRGKDAKTKQDQKNKYDKLMSAIITCYDLL